MDVRSRRRLKFEIGFFRQMVTDIEDAMLRNVFRALQLLQEVNVNIPVVVGPGNIRIFYPNEIGLPGVFVVQSSTCFLVIGLA